MTLNLPLLYWLWFVEYCQNSPNKNKSPNHWHVTSILVCCIFAVSNRIYHAILLQVMCIFLYSALRERAVVEGIKPTTEKTHRGNPIKRAKWHLGIRSQSKPQDIMNEVYRAMKTLNFVSLGNCRKKNWHFSSNQTFFFN